MKILFYISIATVLFASPTMKAQQDTSPNVILITLDGVRWQDVFTGIDTNLLNSSYTHDKQLLSEKFVGASIEI
jgi:hypothetical protein